MAARTRRDFGSLSGELRKWWGRLPSVTAALMTDAVDKGLD
jgi:hypothetical protein